MRSPEAIAKQKATFALNKALRAERDKKRQERKLARTVGIRTPVAPIGPRPTKLEIDVDWQFLPMGEAQEVYAKLKVAFESAGHILNARSRPDGEFYTCFMAGKPKCCKPGELHRRPARGRDFENGMKDPATGLVTPVEICSENCWIRWQDVLIKARRDRFLVPQSA